MTRLVALIAAPLLTCSHLYAIDKPPAFSDEALARFQEASEEILTGRIHLLANVTVVDQHGKPVPNFSVIAPHSLTDKEYDTLQAERGHAVELHKRSPVLGMKKYREAEDKFRGKRDTIAGKDGEIHIDAKNVAASDLYLRFSAPGYYATEMALDVPGGEDAEMQTVGKQIEKSLRTNAAMPTELPVRRTFQVAMRKKGKITAFDRLSVELSADNKGERLGYRFRASNAKDKSGPLTLDPKTKWIPSHSLLLSLEKDKSGKIRVEKTEAKEVASGVTLVLKSTPGDGFILSQPRDIRERGTGAPGVHYSYNEPVRRQMALAPESGYALELPLRFDDGPLYFFFKCDGRYACAHCTFLELANDRSKFVLRLDVELQPDGTRNLAAEE